jgi:hypothetical protein
MTHELAGKHKQSPIILVRQETTAGDIHGMDAAVGFLSAHGHASDFVRTICHNSKWYDRLTPLKHITYQMSMNEARDELG